MLRFATAVHLYNFAESGALNDRLVRFITPTLSAVVAASSVAKGKDFWSSLNLTPEGKSYADTIGLTSVLSGGSPPSGRHGSQGHSYSQLVCLRPETVDECNRLIADVIFAQLGNTAIASRLSTIVGELHDNVASHANGAGFSAGQVYTRCGRRELEFCVADAGQGMLRNVQRVAPDIKDDLSAIQWCLERGNTSAKPVDSWAQKLPDDVGSSPFGPNVDTFTEENHHAGIGLSILHDVIANLGGEIWIWSGGQQVTIRDREFKPFNNIKSADWRGVVIAFRVRVPEEDVQPMASDREQIARSIGLE